MISRCFFSLLCLIIPQANAACSIADIAIISIKANMGKHGLQGVSVLENRCTEAIGVQLKIIGLDKTGNPVASKDFWPASANNIAPGNYTFSLDYWLDYDPSIKKVEIIPIEVKPWRIR